MQDRGSTRGVVGLTQNSKTANVLTASFVNSLESTKKLVIPGPGQVTINPTDGNPYISYRMEKVKE